MEESGVKLDVYGTGESVTDGTSTVQHELWAGGVSTSFTLFRVQATLGPPIRLVADLDDHVLAPIWAVAFQNSLDPIQDRSLLR